MVRRGTSWSILYATEDNWKPPACLTIVWNSIDKALDFETFWKSQIQTRRKFCWVYLENQMGPGEETVYKEEKGKRDV